MYAAARDNDFSVGIGLSSSNGGSGLSSGIFANAADTNTQRLERVGQKLKQPFVDPAEIERITEGFHLNPDYENFLITVSERAVERLWNETQDIADILRNNCGPDPFLYQKLAHLMVEEANAVITEHDPSWNTILPWTWVHTYQKDDGYNGFYQSASQSVHLNTLHRRPEIDRLSTIAHEVAHHFEEILSIWSQKGKVPSAFKTIAEEFRTADENGAYIRAGISFKAYKSQLNEQYANIVGNKVNNMLMNKVWNYSP